MVSNPMLLFSMIRGTPLENNPAIQGHLAYVYNHIDL